MTTFLPFASNKVVTPTMTPQIHDSVMERVNDELAMQVAWYIDWWALVLVHRRIQQEVGRK